MVKQTHLKKGILILLGIGLVSGLTYYLTPEKVKIKVEEKIKIVEGEKQVVFKERVVTIIKKPDGTVIEKEEEREETKKEKETISESEKVKTKSITRVKKNNLIDTGMLFDPLQPGSSTVILSYKRRLIGEIYVGVIATSEGSIGPGITIRF